MEEIGPTTPAKNNDSEISRSPATELKLEQPRAASLRKRNSTMKKSKGKSLDHISDHELSLTSLPAHSCRIINCKLRQSLIGNGTPYSDIQPFVCTTDGFHVKSGHVFQYSGELTFCALSTCPSSMCPAPWQHETNVKQLGHELPLACPTCWSIQRNA
ncbi:hypothetical protein DPMN_166100 [Dreissena polymorpha]|uniref:Uncharacterized protein n=1 Tax=Dreissena polymorpha TaxID=45954 RepID=A0A9D4EY28_DREPO|nr:hypothetical protein DPMN_166100 [Dreissena polymorpha]